MFGSAALELLLCLFLVYGLLSTLASGLQELLASWTASRARMLKRKLTRLLGSAGVNTFYVHPLIQACSEQQGKPPEHIPPEVFAAVTLEGLLSPLFETSESGKVTFEQLQQCLARAPASPAKTIALTSLHLSGPTSGPSLAALQTALANWFKQAMTQTSQHYRSNVRRTLGMIGFVIAALFNADSIALAHKLWHQANLRTQLSTAAATYNAASTTSLAYVPFEQLFGWSSSEWAILLARWPLKLLGFCLTAFAISVGSTFWFSVLSKFAGFRPTARRPASSS